MFKDPGKLHQAAGNPTMFHPQGMGDFVEGYFGQPLVQKTLGDPGPPRLVTQTEKGKDCQTAPHPGFTVNMGQDRQAKIQGRYSQTDRGGRKGFRQKLEDTAGIELSPGRQKGIVRFRPGWCYQGGYLQKGLKVGRSDFTVHFRNPSQGNNLNDQRLVRILVQETTAVLIFE